MCDVTEIIHREICAEKCAMYGEPPCYSVKGSWPNRDCNEPGCFAEAQRAADELAIAGVLQNGADK